MASPVTGWMPWARVSIIWRATCSSMDASWGCGGNCISIQLHRNVQEGIRVDVPMSQKSSDHPCLACGACCAAFRVDFSAYEMEDQGGTVPMGLAVEVHGNTWRLRGTDH